MKTIEHVFITKVAVTGLEVPGLADIKWKIKYQIHQWGIDCFEIFVEPQTIVLDNGIEVILEDITCEIELVQGSGHIMPCELAVYENRLWMLS